MGSLTAGRQRLDRNVDEQAQRELRILLHRPLRPEEERLLDLLERDRAPAHAGDDATVQERVADADLDVDRRLGPGCELDEAAKVDGNDDERLAEVDEPAGLGGARRARGPCPRPPSAGVAVEVVDHLAAAASDQREHVREVHLPQRAVEQEQEEQHAREQQGEREGLREHEVRVRVPADDGESQRGRTRRWR